MKFKDNEILVSWFDLAGMSDDENALASSALQAESTRIQQGVIDFNWRGVLRSLDTSLDALQNRSFIKQRRNKSNAAYVRGG